MRFYDVILFTKQLVVTRYKHEVSWRDFVHKTAGSDKVQAWGFMTWFCSQNPFNPAHTGLDRLPDSSYEVYWPKQLQVVLWYCCCTWAAQQIRGVFHFFGSFRAIRLPFPIFWSLYSWRSWLSRRQGGQEITQQLIYRHSWKYFWTCVWEWGLLSSSAEVLVFLEFHLMNWRNSSVHALCLVLVATLCTTVGWLRWTV